MSTLPEQDMPAAGLSGTTLGDHVHGQLLRLGAVVGLREADTALYGQILLDSLSDTARRPLSLPPASPSFLSDDHTPVEFSLACTANADPVLRVLVEPGCAHADMADSARAGLGVIRAMAGRWDFSTDQLDALEDLFFPTDAEGPLALWYALELRPGGVPGIKVYLNPRPRAPDKRLEQCGKHCADSATARASENSPTVRGTRSSHWTWEAGRSRASRCT